MKKITIKDVSNALKLSISTVSKALSDSHEISPETKKRVLAYVAANNYKPNRIAKNLKNGYTSTIGIVLCAINNTFVSQVLDGIQQASLKSDYDIIIMQSFENEENEKSCLDVLVARGVDGILLAPVSENSNLEFLKDIHQNICPVVLFDRIHSSLKTTKIGVNEFQGSYDATRQLILNKRTRILFITGTHFSLLNPRLLGFKKALSDAGLHFNPEYLIECNLESTDEIDWKIRSTIELFNQRNIKPNAIFGATEVITTRCLGVLADLQISVPEQMAVIGFANTEIAFSLNPSLSTIRQPASEIGALALKKLMEIISTSKMKRAYETILLETSIQLRNSTRTS